jgi:hypothetical protein
MHGDDKPSLHVPGLRTRAWASNGHTRREVRRFASTEADKDGCARVILYTPQGGHFFVSAEDYHNHAKKYAACTHVETIQASPLARATIDRAVLHTALYNVLLQLDSVHGPLENYSAQDLALFADAYIKTR